MTFSRKEFHIQNSEHGNLAPSHLIFIDPRALLRIEQRCPDKEGTAVSPLLKVGHDTVDNVRLGREDVEGIGIAISRTAVGDLFNVCV